MKGRSQHDHEIYELDEDIYIYSSSHRVSTSDTSRVLDGCTTVVGFITAVLFYFLLAYLFAHLFYYIFILIVAEIIDIIIKFLPT